MDLSKINLRKKSKFRNSLFGAVMDKDPQMIDTDLHYSKCGFVTSIGTYVSRIIKMGIFAFSAELRIRDIYAGSPIPDLYYFSIPPALVAQCVKGLIPR
jgi:hypothetical protein